MSKCCASARQRGQGLTTLIDPSSSFLRLLPSAGTVIKGKKKKCQRCTLRPKGCGRG